MGTLFRRSRNGKRSCWIAEYTTVTGRRVQKSTRTTDKKTASQILAHWESEEAKRISGLVDPVRERLASQGARSIDDHLAEWLDSLRSKGTGEKHVERVKGHVDRILESAGCSQIGQLQAEMVERYAKELRDGKAMPRTIQSHLRSIKQFTRWAVAHGPLAADPLAQVRPPSAESDRSIERRAFSVDEWRWLKSTTIAEPDRYGMTGIARALLYETSLQTGLRANELRQLQTAKLHLESSPPFVLAARRSTKNRQPARQYITAKLATDLAVHSKRKQFVFPDLVIETAEMIRDDLIAARDAWLESQPKDPDQYFLAEKNAAGERIDFHALRHTCGAWLAMAGVHPKAIQSIMRHSSITLTMDTYGHLFPAMEADAIAKLGELLA